MLFLGTTDIYSRQIPIFCQIHTQFQHGLTHGDALSLLLFNCALEYAIINAKEDKIALGFNGAHLLLTYAYDDNLLGEKIGALLEVSQ
jgi:hypothetical protein